MTAATKGRRRRGEGREGCQLHGSLLELVRGVEHSPDSMSEEEQVEGIHDQLLVRCTMEGKEIVDGRKEGKRREGTPTRRLNVEAHSSIQIGR